jgi:hypothetical protein
MGWATTELDFPQRRKERKEEQRNDLWGFVVGPRRPGEQLGFAQETQTAPRKLRDGFLCVLYVFAGNWQSRRQRHTSPTRVSMRGAICGCGVFDRWIWCMAPDEKSLNLPLDKCQKRA